MANYRTIKMSFWNDPFIEDLEAGAKLLYLYLMTSPHTNHLGYLEISRKRIAFETGLEKDQVTELLVELEQAGKLAIDGYGIWITNFIEHQTSNSPKMVECLKGLLPEIPEKIRSLILARYADLFGDMGADTHSNGMDTPADGYAKGMDRVSIPPEELKLKEELKEELKKEIKDSPPLPPRGECELLALQASQSETPPRPNPESRSRSSSKSELAAEIAAYAQDPELREALSGFVQMRERIRKPLTLRALKLTLKKLDELAPFDAGEKIAILDQSVQRSWQGVFPLSEPQRAVTQQFRPQAFNGDDAARKTWEAYQRLRAQGATA